MKMNRTVNIIYFSSRADAVRISEKLSSRNIKAELLPVKKCLITEDIADYFVFDRNLVSPLEKNYLRDGRTKPAALLSIQKIILDRLLAEADENSMFFVEESPVPECFYIRKTLFGKGIPFFSFGRIASEFGLSVVRGSLDIGFHEASFLSQKEYCGNGFSAKISDFPSFNGITAIDAPPDSLPARYLRFFRSPLQLTRALIRFYDSFEAGKRHKPVFVYSSPHTYDGYTSCERAGQFAKLLGGRGMTFSDFSELPKGTTVFTWSTKRFFSLIKNGFRPVPATKSLAAKVFDPKIKSPCGLMLSSPDRALFEKVEKFLLSCELDNRRFEDSE